MWPAERLPEPLRQTLRERARDMRKTMSAAEVKLWTRLRDDQFYGYRFRRQHVIGPYVADFFCPALDLVVEVDGDSHFEPEQEQWDRDRTAYFSSRGLREIRFTNFDVLKHINGVLDGIARFAGIEDPLPRPLPQAGEGG